MYIWLNCFKLSKGLCVTNFPTLHVSDDFSFLCAFSPLSFTKLPLLPPVLAKQLFWTCLCYHSRNWIYFLIKPVSSCLFSLWWSTSFRNSLYNDNFFAFLNTWNCIGLPSFFIYNWTCYIILIFEDIEKTWIVLVFLPFPVDFRIFDLSLVLINFKGGWVYFYFCCSYLVLICRLSRPFFFFDR